MAVRAFNLAVTSASSLHVAGNGFSGKQPIEVDLSVATKDAKGSISLDGLGFDLIRAGDTIYIRGSDANAHPHYYCDLAGLAALFAGFELLSLTQEEQRRPGSWHWHILAERR